MKVTVIGTGYVGLVTGACLAEMGNHVLCLDRDAGKIERLARGEIPIHEPGLEPLVQRNAAAGRLQFTTDAAAAVAHGTIVMIGVGTPPDEDGSADLTQVLAAAGEVGRWMTDYKVVVDKSTVPVGTADLVRDTVRAALVARGMAALPFAVVSNPEFLKEGAAVEDCLRPDRIIVGADDERAVLLLRALYMPFMRNHERLFLMDPRSAELTKYAANAMLATRISFMNEIARLAERVGADIEQVRRGIGSDPRIGRDFLYPGTGFGGSCFPKDLRALLACGAAADVELGVLQAVQRANQRQKRVLVEKIEQAFGADLSGRRFALWGLAFKPDTDDLREAPSLTVVTELLARGAEVQAYDPAAMPAAARRFCADAGFRTMPDAMSALAGADALVIVTEWKQFRTPDFAALAAALRERLVFDGRNLYDPALMAPFGLRYCAIGRGLAQPPRVAPAVPSIAAA